MCVAQIKSVLLARISLVPLYFSYVLMELVKFIPAAVIFALFLLE